MLEATKIEIKKRNPLASFAFEATFKLSPEERAQFDAIMNSLKPNQENDKKMTNTPLSTQEKIEALQIAISTLPLLENLNEQQVRLFCKTLAEQNDHVFFYSDWV